MARITHLYQITAPHFCAGFIRVNGVVGVAAPIIKYMVGWPIGKVRRYCEMKGWRLEWVEEGFMEELRD